MSGSLNHTTALPSLSVFMKVQNCCGFSDLSSSLPSSPSPPYRSLSSYVTGSMRSDLESAPVQVESGMESRKDYGSGTW